MKHMVFKVPPHMSGLLDIDDKTHTYARARAHTHTHWHTDTSTYHAIESFGPPLDIQ